MTWGMGQRKGRRAKNRADYSTAWRNCAQGAGRLRFELLQILQQFARGVRRPHPLDRGMLVEKYWRPK